LLYLEAKSLRRWMELFKKLVNDYINIRMSDAKSVGELPISDKSETVFKDIYNKHVKSVSVL
jgi:hypothetical protein